MIQPEQALAAAHADARLRIEAARTVLRMAIMFPDKMAPKEACERALKELDEVPQVAILLREVPVEVPYSIKPDIDRVRGISAQQARILYLVSEGYNNNEIAAQMHLSPFTVKSHLSRVYKTLRVHNRAEAVAKVMDQKHGSNPGTH